MAKTRRAPGAGHLFVRRSKAGRESWYAKWRTDGDHQVLRKIGPKRDGNGHGLDRKEAERRLRELIAEVAPPPASRVSIEGAGGHLIEHLRAMGRKPATIEAYDSLLRVHLAPFFAGRSLDAITADDLEAFIRERAQAGKSAKTIRNAIGFLSSICNYAQRKGWARSNPCGEVDLPAHERSQEIHFLEPEEVEAVVRAEAEVGDDLAPTLSLMYRTAAMTGLRQGESIALRWQDIDWSAGKVRVRRSWVRGEYSTPKSRRGSRSVPLADELAGDLERHHQGSRYQDDDDLVFAHPTTGRPLDRSKVRKRFRAAVARAGVRQVRYHDLRHSFATRMAAVGVPMRTLMEFMGHADIKTTLVYSDYAPSEREREWVEVAFARGPATPPEPQRA